MTLARIKLAAAALAFFGWLAYLGYAVTQRGTVSLVSRGQLTGATHLVVADVTLAGALPAPTATVAEVLRGDGPAVGKPIEVVNLPAAMPPGAGGFPGPGKYLLPLMRESGGAAYRVPGLPRSPGYEPATAERPVIYPWTDDVRKQLAGLGLGK